MDILFSLLKGFGTSGGLIIGIGAQNAFVIRQGLKQQHLLLTALICSIIDSILIMLGVIGFDQLISAYPIFVDVTKYFAVVFLFLYGTLTLKSAFKTKMMEVGSNNEVLPAVSKTVLALLALSLLNPHVYLDTVMLLGSIANQHPAETQIYFALGAIAASFTWFFGITYGARMLAPLLRKQHAWKVVDVMTTITMWAMAIALLKFF